MLKMVTASNFKELHRQRRIVRVGDLGVRKQMLAPVEPNPHVPRSLRFTISSACVDRERDIISLDGWQLDNFGTNPVVLWGHDYSRLPIGRAYDLAIEDDRLKASVQFVSPDTPIAGEFADAVYQLAVAGFLNATSVGFRPIKWEFSTDPERGADDWMGGIDFQQQELVEFSVVTVPANPEALMEPVAASDTPPQSDDALAALDASGAAMKARRRRVLALLEANLPPMEHSNV